MESISGYSDHFSLIKLVSGVKVIYNLENPIKQKEEKNQHNSAAQETVALTFLCPN